MKRNLDRMMDVKKKQREERNRRHIGSQVGFSQRKIPQRFLPEGAILLFLRASRVFLLLRQKIDGGRMVVLRGFPVADFQIVGEDFRPEKAGGPAVAPDVVELAEQSVHGVGEQDMTELHQRSVQQTEGAVSPAAERFLLLFAAKGGRSSVRRGCSA